MISVLQAIRADKRLPNSLPSFAGSALFRAALLVGIIFALCFSVSAKHTRRWRQSSYDEFVKGTAHGVAVRSDGRLELAPKVTPLADADASYLWSLRTGPNESLYASGGSPARVFRFDGAGKPTTVFASTDLAAQTIAFDAQGTLFVGTSPDGKVYKVSSSGEKTVFFDPKTKYIWDLLFASDGTLYVATGDKGQIFAVAPDGKSTLFYDSDEAHIRVLAFDAQHRLLAGTEPSGRILRITPRDANAKPDAKSSTKSNEKTADKKMGQADARGSADGFVLYESAKREVTALAVAGNGTIYASAIGEKQRGTGQAPTTVITTPQGTTTFTNSGVLSSPAGQPAFTPFPTMISSSIYRITPDGAPDELWTSRDDVVYSLGMAQDGRLLAGTGNNGALLAIDQHGAYAQLAKAGSAQITGIVRNAQGKVFLCTANPGKVFSVGPEYEPEGSYESRSFDAQIFSQWGRVEWWSSPVENRATTVAKNGVAKNGHANSDPRLEFFVRSGNSEEPGAEWSRWFGPYAQSGSSIEAPPARYVQWKVVIHDGRPGDGIYWVSVAYLPRNIAPVIDGIQLQDPGVRAQATFITAAGQQQSVTLKQPPSDNTNGVIITQSGTPPHFEQPPQGFVQKGYDSVLWNAHDANDDDLKYAIYYRGENERDWKLLKDKLDQKFFSWDTTTMPDGAYYLKIVASDAPSNPPDVALTTERESERFEIDNTPPVIENLKAVLSSFQTGSTGEHLIITVDFTAHDASTSIERAQYSLDGGEWILCAPETGISDAPEERYGCSIARPAAGEHTIAVRAYDRFENVGSAKTAITIPPSK
jgi:outer membrane protein assembly factor BamB